MLDVLFISSASRRLHIAAPSLYSNSWVLGLYAEKPTISEGMTSGVNCILLHLYPIALANPIAMVVFPTPGISSISICPPAVMASMTLSTASSLPVTTFFTSLSIASIVPCMIIFSLYDLFRHRLHINHKPVSVKLCVIIS